MDELKQLSPMGMDRDFSTRRDGKSFGAPAVGGLGVVMPCPVLFPGRHTVDLQANNTHRTTGYSRLHRDTLAADQWTASKRTLFLARFAFQLLRTTIHDTRTLRPSERSDSSCR